MQLLSCCKTYVAHNPFTSSSISMAIKATSLRHSNKFKKGEWHPLSWNDRNVKQLPTYPDTEKLQRVYGELRELPRLFTSWEIETLKSKLADVAAGNAFLLQGGDCAETCDACRAPKIVNVLTVLLQMRLSCVHEMGAPVVRTGGLARQYGTPRSSEYE